jgi:hypothetical protein
MNETTANDPMRWIREPVRQSTLSSLSHLSRCKSGQKCPETVRQALKHIYARKERIEGNDGNHGSGAQCGLESVSASQGVEGIGGVGLESETDSCGPKIVRLTPGSPGLQPVPWWSSRRSRPRSRSVLDEANSLPGRPYRLVRIIEGAKQVERYWLSLPAKRRARIRMRQRRQDERWWLESMLGAIAYLRGLGSGARPVRHTKGDVS